MDDNAFLIEQVKSFPIIYDRKKKLHKDILAVEKAWETIAIIMTSSIENVKNRWKNLRTYYTRAKKINRDPEMQAISPCGRT